MHGPAKLTQTLSLVAKESHSDTDPLWVRAKETHSQQLAEDSDTLTTTRIILDSKGAGDDGEERAEGRETVEREGGKSR